MKGFYVLLIVLYAIILAFPDFFNERKWIVILPLIGFIAYVGLMVSAFAISFPLYGTAWLATALVLVILYMILIPLYAVFQYTRQDRMRGSPRVIWIWVFMLGTLLWAIGLTMLFGGWLYGLPGFTEFFSAEATMLVSALAIGWYLILISYFFQGRILRAAKS